MIEVYILSALTDNYVYVLRETKTERVAVIDPSESVPVLQFLNEKNWPLHFIFNTHHHHDHVGGNLKLKALYGCEIYCSSYDFQRVPGATRPLQDKEDVEFGASRLQVLSVPGHTLGAVSYFSQADQIVFTGDTLFTSGCGRLFEGTPAQMWQSLQRLAKLPTATKVFSGHEYGLQNAGFAAHISPKEPDIREFFKSIKEARKAGSPTVPSTIGQEIRLNPFIKARNVGEFAQLRRAKDEFRLEDIEALG